MIGGAAQPQAAELSELAQKTLRELLRAWFEFERHLARVPIVQRGVALDHALRIEL